MRVMVFVKATEDSEKGVFPPIEAFAAMDKINEELVRAGIMVAGGGLKPSAQSKRISINGADRSVIDGPFAEIRELVAGFSIWEVKDLDEAVAWALRFPHFSSGPNELEIRPFLEAADFGDALPPEPADAAPRDPMRQKLGVA